MVGRGEGEQFFASAVPAFLAQTRPVQYLDDGEIVGAATRRRHDPEIAGEVVEREVVQVDWDEEPAEKGGYETFMLKEIHEQADALAETISTALRAATVSIWTSLGARRGYPRRCRASRGGRLRNSFHAGLVGRYAIEDGLGCPSTWTSPRSTATAIRS